MSDLRGWERTTLRQELEALAPDQVAVPVTCACGRKELPSAMIDVRAVPTDIRLTRARELPAPTPDFLCQACIEVLHAKGLIDRVSIAQMQGAPLDWLGAYEAQLVQGSILETGLPERVWGEILALELDRAAAAEATRLADLANPVPPEPL